MNKIVSSGSMDYKHQKQMTDADIAFYHENGFFAVENGLSTDQINALCDDTVSICRGKYGKISGIDEFPDETLSDHEVIKKFLCIHFPHKGSKLMYEYLAQEAIKEVLTSVIGPDVKCMQSMLFMKASGKPGQAWHQDELYIPTRDRTLIGAWMALDDATIENGCLWVIPGSHKPGVLWPQEFTTNPEFDCSGESKFPYGDDEAIPLEVKAGTILFFNGYLLHRSLKNRAPEGTFRRVLVNHYMSASSLLPWKFKEETPFATLDFRDIVMIAGSDPYVYKGTEDVTAMHLRSTGEGGCGDGSKKSLEGN
ncbi:MAG: phytanoyl-CoA dioxygenase family protein [Lentisphaeria bacterium]|nr:phytanoyl-CoA dioxygenase family protein [Lentisphaeria bacterium]